jgi:hypothetical protein
MSQINAATSTSLFSLGLGAINEPHGYRSFYGAVVAGLGGRSMNHPYAAASTVPFPRRLCPSDEPYGCHGFDAAILTGAVDHR